MNDLPVYAEVGSYFQQVGGECPDGWTRMVAPRPDGDNSTDYTAEPDGTWVISAETLKAKASIIEIEWQTGEMSAIANQLLALEEEADDALPGTRRQWLTYRTSVRLWHESQDFPDIARRPIRPF